MPCRARWRAPRGPAPAGCSRRSPPAASARSPWRAARSPATPISGRRVAESGGPAAQALQRPAAGEGRARDQASETERQRRGPARYRKAGSLGERRIARRRHRSPSLNKASDRPAEKAERTQAALLGQLGKTYVPAASPGGSAADRRRGRSPRRPLAAGSRRRHEVGRWSSEIVAASSPCPPVPQARAPLAALASCRPVPAPTWPARSRRRRPARRARGCVANRRSRSTVAPDRRPAG